MLAQYYGTSWLSVRNAVWHSMWHDSPGYRFDEWLLKGDERHPSPRGERDRQAALAKPTVPSQLHASKCQPHSCSRLARTHCMPHAHGRAGGKYMADLVAALVQEVYMDLVTTPLREDGAPGFSKLRDCRQTHNNTVRMATRQHTQRQAGWLPY